MLTPRLDMVFIYTCNGKYSKKILKGFLNISGLIGKQDAGDGRVPWIDTDMDSFLFVETIYKMYITYIEWLMKCQLVKLY